MTRSLDVLLGNELVGTLLRQDGGFLSFLYEPGWTGRRDARPLSQSLPLRPEPFNERECLPFFSGLLPDSDRVRSALAARLDAADKDDDFGLLTALGRDCAGAVVLSPTGLSHQAREDGWLEKLDEAALASLIEQLPTRPLFAEEDEVMLSLAGVHDKAAVYVDPDGGIYLPHRGYPSTHILKTDIKGLPDSIRTEHFCLRVARELKLPAPPSTIALAGKHVYMLVRRYDRVLSPGTQGGLPAVRRLHQEDFCQATGTSPRAKYERQGGPWLKSMFAMLRNAATVPAKEVAKLAEYVVFNFLVGNPDSHAKNYSILYRTASVELAPIYDVNNAAAFRRHYKVQRPRVAQAIGGERDPTGIGPEQWRRCAEEIGVGYPQLRRRVIDMARAMPDAAARRREEARSLDADSGVLDLVVEDIRTRCGRVLRDFAAAAA